MEIPVIINLCGPPASGKTTLSIQFCQKHQYNHLDIANFRTNTHNDAAWYNLAKVIKIHIQDNENCIIESCGLDWHLKNRIISEINNFCNLITIVLYGDPANFKHRLTTRNKERNQGIINIKEVKDEKDQVDYYINNIYRAYTRYHALKSDDSISKFLLYQQFEQLINERK